MVFTIQDLVRQNIFSDLKLLAGQKGMRNEIKAINSADILADLSVFHPKELVFTTGYGLQEEKKHSRLVSKLTDCEISGIVIQTGRYLDHIPLYLILQANEYNLPLFSLPASVTLPEIIQKTLPMFDSGQKQAREDNVLKQAIQFLEESVEKHGQTLFSGRADQAVRLLLIEPGNYTSVDKQKWRESFAEILSFLQANTYLCLWRKLPQHRYVFLIACSSEHSPSLMYLLQLKFVGFAGTYGTNYLLGNEYLYSPENLSLVVIRAAEGLNNLHQVKAKRGTCTYDSMCFVSMLSYLRQDSSSIILENQALNQLLKYDKSHNSSYTDTLRLYLAANCNIARTAKMLFIHRHTLIKRLEKIEAISGMKMEDYYARLHMSIAIMFHDYFTH